MRASFRTPNCPGLEIGRCPFCCVENTEKALQIGCRVYSQNKSRNKNVAVPVLSLVCACAEIQYYDRALERFLPRDVLTLQPRYSCLPVRAHGPPTHSILVSPFLSLFLSFTFRNGNCYHFCSFSGFSLSSIMFFSKEVLLTAILRKLN